MEKILICSECGSTEFECQIMETHTISFWGGFPEVVEITTSPEPVNYWDTSSLCCSQCKGNSSIYIEFDPVKEKELDQIIDKKDENGSLSFLLGILNYHLDVRRIVENSPTFGRLIDNEEVSEMRNRVMREILSRGE